MSTSGTVTGGVPPAAPLNRTLQWVVWSILGLLVAVLLAGVVRQQWRAAEQKSTATQLDHFNQVPDFTLTERSGAPFAAASLHGKVWLANFFFTACPGPCLEMNGRLQELQQALDHDKHGDVRIVSFSIAPAMDTPEVLRKYADRFHARENQWFFLTGDQSKIYAIAHDVFLLPVVKNDDPAKRQPDEGDYIHSTKVALVDRTGRVRAYYDSLSPEFQQRALVDIGELLREPAPRP